MSKMTLDRNKLRKKPQDNVIECDLGHTTPDGELMEGLSEQMAFQLKHEGKEESGQPRHQMKRFQKRRQYKQSSKEC